MTDYTSNPITNDELTEMIKNDRYARTLANIARRAETLWEDGYSAKLLSKSANFAHYMVKTPAGDCYSVCLSDEPKHEVFGDYCTCPAFPKYGECKHHLGLLFQLAEQSQEAEFDRMMNEGETSTGCDPYARW